MTETRAGRTCQHLKSHVRPQCAAQAVRSVKANAIVVASSRSIQDSSGIFRSQDHSSVAAIHQPIQSLVSWCRSLRSLHPHPNTHTHTHAHTPFVLKAVHSLTFRHLAFIASTSQKGSPASWPQPGSRSQLPPLGPFEWIFRHVPAQFDWLCRTHALGPGGEGWGFAGMTPGTAQSTHAKV